MTNATNPAGFTWQSYGISNIGNRRKCNEDAFLNRPETGLWVVADGMGGHAAGDVASNMIVDALNDIDAGMDLRQLIDEVEDRLLDCNNKLVEKARVDNKHTIGSTVVIMMAHGQYALYCWAGDSRLYRRRDQKLRQMTTDHSQLQQYIVRGILTPAEALSHPQSNIITRAVGAADRLYVDMDIQRVQNGDRYLLCSDGLTAHIYDPELEILMNATSDAQATCEQLVQIVLDRGAKDNITVVIIDVQSAA